MPAILVVDDEDYVADMLASALKLEGYTVHVAYNGREGLECLQSEAIDLTIIDIMMPYMSGIELIKRIRSLDRQRDLPVILISAGARPREHFAGVTFLSKPFDVDELLAMVAQKAQQRNAPHGLS